MYMNIHIPYYTTTKYSNSILYPPLEGPMFPNLEDHLREFVLTTVILLPGVGYPGSVRGG